MSRRSPLFRVSLAVLAAAVVLYVVRLITHVGLGPLTGYVDDWLYTVVEVLATGLVWARAIVDERDRGAWFALAGFVTLWSVGDFGWTVHFDDVAEPPFPNWTDGAYLASYGFAYVGLVLLLRARVNDMRPSQWLDGLIVGLALAALCAMAFIGPVVASAEGTTEAVAVTLAYPTLDLLLLCIIGVAFAAGSWRPDPMWSALGAAMVVSGVGDAAYSWQEATGAYSAGSWTNATWPVAMALLALAACVAPGRRFATREADGVFGIPATCTASSLGILSASQLRNVDDVAAFAAVGTVAFAGARAWLTHRENVALLRRSRQEALEDGLTRLPNRRRLMLDLERVLAGAATQDTTLVFFDLDGFKSYNDNFGHGAGDALLVRLARALAISVDGVGAAYRLGGDEFCVLYDRGVDREDAEVAAAAAALSEEGEGFAIGSSYGLVALPQEAHSPSLALQLADERMYGHKGARRGMPSVQGRDLLLQVLREREPELEEHVDDVAVLALAVGRELGLDVEALDEIARGAELHDIGKIAVPEAILHKPGPLDDDEWRVMRQHTIVGERILAAAPALRPVARLVRASHESWDGSGYPDGLAGERIPLGSRIISVCDAFDAMRQARPYAASMSEPDALAELRRCAGTQFDPRVVEAFVAVLAQGAGETLRVS